MLAPMPAPALPTPVLAAPVIPVAAGFAARAEARPAPHGTRAPTPAHGLPRPPPNAAYARPSSRPPPSGFEAPHAHVGHAWANDHQTLPPRRSRRRRSGRWAPYLLLALLIAILAVTTYAGPRFASAGTGALEIESVGDPGALVRVDGVVRGNPPLVVEGLAPGVHRVEVEASGFAIARAEVHVEKGRSHGVKLVLDPDKPQSGTPEVQAVQSGQPAQGQAGRPSQGQTAQSEQAATGATAGAAAPEVSSLANGRGKARDRSSQARPRSEPNEPQPSPEQGATREPASEARGAARAPAADARGAEREPNNAVRNQAYQEAVARGAAYDPNAPQKASAAPAPSSAAAPTVEQSGSSETQVAQDLDEELAAVDEGVLLISTVPWSHVYVDDEDTERDTPVRSLRVPAGPHRIGLRTPDDVVHTVDVVVAPGQVVRIIRRF